MSELLTAEKTPALTLVTMALLPEGRAQLHQRIAQRLDSMLAAGFVDEVRGLHARGDLHADLPALRSVGYRQAWRYVEGQYTYDQFRLAALAATRQFAKRQLTWLRSMKQIVAIETTSRDALGKLAELAQRI